MSWARQFDRGLCLDAIGRSHSNPCVGVNEYGGFPTITLSAAICTGTFASSHPVSFAAIVLPVKTYKICSTVRSQ